MTYGNQKTTYLGNLAENRRVNDFLVLAITMLSNFVLEFLFCKLVVYRGKENTLEAESANREDSNAAHT